jgi:endonuclease YncB( thermonuclease family)
MFVYSCKVLNVVDGDTIDIELDLGFNIKMKERVRLLDVDTPEVFGPNAEAAGSIASDFTKKWIDDRQKINNRFAYHSIRYNARDKYGRSLGILMWTGAKLAESLNEAIVASGNIKK